MAERPSRSILFLFPYPLNEAPSQRFRFAQYLSELRDAGYHVETHPYLSDKAWAILYRPGRFFRKFLSIAKGYLKRILLLRRAGRFDYVFIHREVAPLGPPLLEWVLIKVLRKKVIFDFDDAIWLPNYSESNRFFSFLKAYGKTAWICRWAWKLSCGNEYLCAYGRQYNQRVVYNPTTIDTEHYHNRVQTHLNSKLIIGWTGSHSTIRYLKVILPVLEKLEEKLDFEFHVISDIAPDFKLKSLRFIRWQKDREIEDLLAFNIGIMPLVSDAWSSGKCGFKALQYMALGIPAVVSPVGVNTRIVDHGVNGFVCEGSDEWYQALERLLQDRSLLQKMAESTRRKIVEHYSVLSNRNNFLNLFDN